MNYFDLLKILLEGFITSFQIFALTLILSVPLGMFIAFGKMSKHKLISVPINFYISIMRGTPLMLQIIFIYFAPNLLFGISLANYPKFLAVIIAFSINYAAYFAEIFRGGIQSIDKGQHEAAKILGLTKTQTFFRIILPQVIKRVLPASSNEVITLVKDTSLAYVVGVVEMFTLAKKMLQTQGIISLIFAGIIFYIFNWLVVVIFNKLEKKLDYYR